MPVAWPQTEVGLRARFIFLANQSSRIPVWRQDNGQLGSAGPSDQVYFSTHQSATVDRRRVRLKYSWSWPSTKSWWAGLITLRAGIWPNSPAQKMVISGWGFFFFWGGGGGGLSTKIGPASGEAYLAHAAGRHEARSKEPSSCWQTAGSGNTVSKSVTDVSFECWQEAPKRLRIINGVSFSAHRLQHRLGPNFSTALRCFRRLLGTRGPPKVFRVLLRREPAGFPTHRAPRISTVCLVWRLARPPQQPPAKRASKCRKCVQLGCVDVWRRRWNTGLAAKSLSGWWSTAWEVSSSSGTNKLLGDLIKPWPNGTLKSSQLEPSFQLGWIWVSFGHPLGSSWLEFDQAQIFAQLDQSFPSFSDLGQLSPSCFVIVRRLRGRSQTIEWFSSELARLGSTV